MKFFKSFAQSLLKVRHAPTNISNKHYSPSQIATRLYSTKSIKSAKELVFWQNKNTWRRASKNTLNCLVGCNIGDFGTIITLNYLYPGLSFGIVMPLAMANGLATSVTLETLILHRKEGLSWQRSFKTATSMSFMSMLAMELAENATDFMLTGGQASVSEPWFWQALVISSVSGFLAPLPYNYYQLEKYGKSCHTIKSDNSDNIQDGPRLR